MLTTAGSTRSASGAKLGNEMLISLCACLVRLRPLLPLVSTEDCAFENIGARSHGGTGGTCQGPSGMTNGHPSQPTPGQNINPQAALGRRGFDKGSRAGGKSPPTEKASRRAAPAANDQFTVKITRPPLPRLRRRDYLPRDRADRPVLMREAGPPRRAND